MQHIQYHDMQLQLTIDLHPNLTAEEIDTFHAKCKAQSISPEDAMAGLIRQTIKRRTITVKARRPVSKKKARAVA